MSGRFWHKNRVSSQIRLCAGAKSLEKDLQRPISFMWRRQWTVADTKQKLQTPNRVLLLLVLFVFLLFSPFALPTSLFAQSVIDPQWQNLKQDDGLLSNNVLTLLVDEDAIWFGTDKGISRFNGAWQHYPNAASSDVAVSEDADLGQPFTGDVRTLARAESDGAVWAGTTDGWILRFDQRQQSWSTIVHIELEVTALRVTDSTLWVGSTAGLFQYQITSPAASGSDASSTLVLTDLIDAVLNPLESSYVYAIHHAGETTWVGAESGLWQFTDGEWRLIETPGASEFFVDSGDETAQKAITALWIDEEEAVWIGTPYGAARYTVESKSWSVIPIVKSNGMPARVQMLAGGQNDAVWVATDGGGARKFVEHGQITLEYGQLTGNLNDFVRAVATDQDGSIWFATPVGAFRFLERSWFHDPSYGLFGGTLGDAGLHDIRDLLVDSAGTLWIATGAGIRQKEGLTYSDSDIIYHIGDSGLPGRTVLALAQDKSQAIWAGLYGQGLAKYVNGEWSSPIVSTTLPSPVVTALLVQEDLLWIGTEAGLSRYDLTTQTLAHEGAMANSTVESLALDSSGQLWVGTRQAEIWMLQNGAVDVQDAERWRRFDASIFQALAQSAILPQDRQVTLAADPQIPGSMWAAIDDVGLFQWQEENWRNGDPNNHLPTKIIWSLFSDAENGILWIGNEAGVTGFDGESWVTLRDRDGLRSSAIYTIARMPTGGYWFGGRTGLSYYRPDETAPWIQLQGAPQGLKGVTADGAALAEVGEKIDFRFDYGDLLTPQNELQTFYRLTNSQNLRGWQEFERSLTLAFDSAGEYTIDFRVRDQAFNYSAITSLPLTIEPAAVSINVPWLGAVQRNTFQTLVALGLVALLGFAYVSMEIVQGRRRATEAMMRSYNPYVSGEPVRREDMFFGRHSLLQRIVDTLHNNSIMIHGERRIGKTTLLYQLASRLADVDDPDYWFVPIYIDLEGTEQERFFHFLIEEIAHKVLAMLPIDEDQEAELLTATIDQLHYHDLLDTAYSDREFNRDLRNMIRALQQYGEKRYPQKQLRVILLLDEMDVINGFDHLVQQQLRRIFMRDFAATLGAVVAGIQISREWDRIESPWYNLFNEIEVEPFTREQAIELLVEPVKNYYSYEPAALEFIIEQSEGRPFRLQQYALEAVTNMLAQSRRRIKLSDVQAAHRNIQNSTNHAYQDEGLPQSVAASAREQALPPQ